jgi:ribosomal protein S8
MVSKINIYIIFIITIILIAIVFINHNYNKGLETFDTIAPDLTTIPITTNAITTPRNTNSANLDITLQNTIDNIQDTTIKNVVKQSLTDLQMGLQRFSYLDAPISIDDNGQTCMQWGNYDNGQYRASDNACMITDTERKCLSTNGILTLCNNLYKDGYLERMNSIDIQPLLKSSQTEIMYNLGTTTLDTSEKNNSIDKVIDDLITKRNLEIQQKYFIEYNTDNLDEKQKNIEKITKELANKQTDVNLNQAAFSQFLQTNSNNDRINGLYFKIFIGLIICIIIILILNVLFSNIL